MTENTTSPLGQCHFDRRRADQESPGSVVRGTVEETLNALLDAEAGPAVQCAAL
jgi:hypothetical protein